MAPRENLPTVKELLTENYKAARLNFGANIVLIVATILLVIAAAIDAKTNREELLSQRPYLAIIGASMRKNGNEYQVITSIKNIGVRPIGEEMKLEFHTVRGGRTQPFDRNIERLVIANEYPPGIEYQYSSPMIMNTDIQALPEFIVITFDYVDPILGEKYWQKYYFKWNSDGPLEWVKDMNDKKLLDTYMQIAAQDEAVQPE